MSEIKEAIQQFKDSSNLAENVLKLFTQLNIPYHVISKQPVKAVDFFTKTDKHNAAIAQFFTVALVNEEAFRSESNITDFQALRKKDKYDALGVFAVQLAIEKPSRTILAEITRAINREMEAFPVVVVFRYGNQLALASTERTNYKHTSRAGEKVGKVALLRDISIEHLHTGHYQILNSLVVNRTGKNAINTFEDLYKYWLSVFNVSLLSKQFYRELSDWYFWAMGGVHFPDDAEAKKDVRNATSLIRLITRVIFIWFIKEKSLVPDKIFERAFLKTILKDFNKNKKSYNYYNAILQNLFFGTLNQKMDEREFAESSNKVNKPDQGIKNKYRYPELFAISEKEVMHLFKDVPFLNGGLFDCLDKFDEEKLEQGKKEQIFVDGFTRIEDKRALVPDYLFFGEEVEVDLTKYYDPDAKKPIIRKVKGLIDILNSYKFTIAENTPIEEEIALDPELLGKVFENLLASYNPETQTTARKQTGSFYTPREIVNYMVDESLLEYIRQNVKNESEDFETRLRELISYTETPNSFDEKETKALIEGINNCKILDPACGSGAYPMGVLHKMVHILQKLDPENKYWKELQHKKAIEETDAAFKIGEKELRTKRLTEINDVFENNASDYGRKLYLIENCIYGIDIQPIAVQISKLRFFISLITDQKVNKQKENFGVRSLPNLETKFVAANTLIGLDKPAQTLLRNPHIEEKETELKELRHKYFTANTRKEKLQYQKQDKRLRQEIAKMLESDGWQTAVAKQIVAFDPYDQNTFAPWFDPEWMFGLSKGFDIVIGNPPYVSIQKMEDTDALRKAKYETFENTGDLYSLFYEQGINLLREQGILCYITSNKWINANYGKSTRKYFATKTNPLILIDFAKVKIFEAATVFVNILITEKAKNRNMLQACSIDGDALPEIEVRDYFNSHKFELRDLGAGIWKVSNAAAGNINSIIESRGIILKKWNDIGLYAGIKSGLNEAFHIDGELRKLLIKKDPKNAQIIKPLLRGKDIKRWLYSFENWYILNTHNGLRGSIKPINVIKDYPDIYAHLRKFNPAVQERQDHGVHWTNLRDCAFLLEFNNPKIVWIEISDRANYAYDESGMLLTNSAYFMTGKHLKYILAVLNSKVADYYFFQITATIAGGRKRYTGQYVEKVPVPQIPEEEEEPFNKIVDYILYLKSFESDQEARQASNYFESLLEAMVYQLYLPEEIKAVGAEVLKHLGNLPDLKKGQEEKNLKTLEKVYKELSAPKHPVSLAMQNLHSIDEVNIIEGKK